MRFREGGRLDTSGVSDRRGMGGGRGLAVGGGGLRVAGAMASMARFEGEPHLDLVPARQEVHGSVEVRFTMSEPDQEVFRG